MLNPFMALSAVAIGGIVFGKMNGSEAAVFNGYMFLGIFLPVAMIWFAVDVKKKLAGKKKEREG
jgi:hypothetical protein